MNNFWNNWNDDPKFKVKVKLGIYTGFVLFALIFALASRNTTIYEDDISIDDNNQKTSITIPSEYEYTIDITINDKKYRYEGAKNPQEETIIKIIDNSTHYYMKKEDQYYKGTTIMNGTVSKEEVYDIIDYSYLNLETINQYLSLSSKNDSKYLVYLKDIILGNDSQEYITIEIAENKISINYTSLLKTFDKKTESCIVDIIIEEKE